MAEAIYRGPLVAAFKPGELLVIDEPEPSREDVATYFERVMPPRAADVEPIIIQSRLHHEDARVILDWFTIVDLGGVYYGGMDTAYEPEPKPCRAIADQFDDIRRERDRIRLEEKEAKEKAAAEREKEAPSGESAWGWYFKKQFGVGS